MTITEKVAYLKGLAEGLGIDDSSKEGKVLKAIIDTLDDIAVTVSDLEDEVCEIDKQVKLIDEDLGAIEDDYYGDDDDDDDDDDEDKELYEVKCPACNDTVFIDEEMIEEGEMECPNCGELLEFDFDDSCCCGEDHGEEKE